MDIDERGAFQDFSDADHDHGCDSKHHDTAPGTVGGSGWIRATDLPRMKRLHWTSYATLPCCYSHTPQLHSAGDGEGCFTDSAANTDVSTDTAMKVAANHARKVRIVFIVLYFITDQ